MAKKHNQLSKWDLRSGVCFRSGRYATAKNNTSTTAPSAGRYMPPETKI
jgi:hypothetical protein